MTKREYIIASAGHGKTEQITDFVLEFGNNKKVLILTHTNAGIHSLTKRLMGKHIDQDKYDLHTIDSFCITYAKAYPKTSGILEVPKTNEDYEKCRNGVLAVFYMDFLQNFLKNRYSLVIVDEYQDCSESQHNLILKITENVDCIILGDPMQGIFNFGTEKLVTWDNIRNTFSKHPKELLIPHRWGEGREKLGEWLKKTREAIINGNEIRFEGDHIHFFRISEKHEMTRPIFDVLNKCNNVLIIVKDESTDGNARKYLAQNFHGIIQIIDPMDFKMFYTFLEKLISSNNKELFENIIFFFKNCMTRSNHFVDTLTTKVKKIWHKKPESITELRKKKIMTHGDGFEVRGKKLNTLYQLILDVIEKTEVQRTKSMILLMENIEKFIKEYKPSEEGYIYRKDIWNSVKNTLHVYIAKNGEKPLVDYGRHIRQRISFAGRGFRKVVGTTLLTKGLEYEHVIIDTSGILDAKHLYVALSRAKKEITVFGVDKKIRLERPLNI